MACLFGVMLASCQDDTENFDNAVYAPATDLVTTINVKNNSEKLTGYVEAKLSKEEGVDVEVSFFANAAKVADYNAMYTQNYVELPSRFYSIPEAKITIPAGANTTGKVEVNFINLLELDKSKVYVLPVTMDCQLGSLSNNTYYFVIREAAMVSVVPEMTDNYGVFVEGDQATELGELSQLTVQALLYPFDFPRMLHTIMGVEDYFLIRVGDGPIPPNQVQLATKSNGKGDNATDAAWQLDTNRWTEFTLTYDTTTGETKVYFNGVQKGSTQICAFREPVDWNTASGDITDGPRGFYVGYSYAPDRSFNGYMAEMRIWNRVLTKEEINEPFQAYEVAPDSPGLVAYWKADEGAGNVFHDYANGYDLRCQSAPKWIPVALPNK